MARVFTIFVSIFSLAGCAFSERSPDETNHFSGTTRAVNIGDSARIEFQDTYRLSVNDSMQFDTQRLTVNHYIEYDSTGDVTFINHTVSVSNIISQADQINDSLASVFRIGRYELKYELDSSAGENASAILNHQIRAGRFQFYSNNEIIREAFIQEEITEGNGTYANDLYLVNPNNRDTIQFSHFYDPWLVKSYSWKWEDVVPMNWHQYQQHIERTRKPYEELVTD